LDNSSASTFSQADREGTTRHADLNFVEANGEQPFPAAQFDIVLAFTAFSSILDQSIATRIATEITRVLATGGVIIWYDCAIQIRSTLTWERWRSRPSAACMSAELNSLTLLPPVAERLGSFTDALFRGWPRYRSLDPNFLFSALSRCCGDRFPLFIIALDACRTISEAIFAALRLIIAQEQFLEILTCGPHSTFQLATHDTFANTPRQETSQAWWLVNSLRCIAPGVLLARRTRAVLAVATLASHESVVSIDLAGKPQPGPGDDSQGLSFGIASRQVDQAPTFFRLIDAV
jgi:hypothetical protein